MFPLLHSLKSNVTHIPDVKMIILASKRPTADSKAKLAMSVMSKFYAKLSENTSFIGRIVQNVSDRTFYAIF
ncbi:hypothetical protein APU02_10285 [Citrobacter sp. 50677481]|nr:hypothetical protein APU02_10285 [Citrobacter sp. 50677481]